MNIRNAQILNQQTFFNFDIDGNLCHESRGTPCLERFDFAAAQNQNMVFICGGRDRSLNLSSETFIIPKDERSIKVRPLPKARSRHAISVARDNTFIISGGVSETSNGNLCLADTVLKYDLDSDRWDEIAKIPLGPSQHVSEIIGNKLIIIGGDNGTITEPGYPLQPTVCHKEVQILNMDTGEWSFGACKPIPETGVTSAVLGDEIFVVSSYDDFGTVTASVEVYNVIENSWRRIPDMPTPRTGVPCGFIDGKLICINGQGANLKPVAAIEVYDPQKNSWDEYPCDLIPTMSQAYTSGTNSLIILGGIKLVA